MDDGEVPPPPTSPFLAAEGAASGAPTTGFVRTGHSASGPSQPARKRGNKAGKAKQTSKLIKRWQEDFDRLADWLYRETGFSLHYFHHAQADFEFIWTLRVFKALLKYCTPDQILVHLCNVFPPYRNWTVTHGLRRHEGTRFTSAVIASTNLPDRDHINLQVFGDADPSRSVWDDYNQYRGPQPKGRGRGGRGSGSAFVDNTEPPSEPENSLGIDPVAARGDTSSSDETHTPPSPKGPPKAKPRPKPAEPKAKAEPKQPDTPPPGWTPSLRPAEHPIVTTSVRSIHQAPQAPPSSVGAAPWRSTAAAAPVTPPKVEAASVPEAKASEAKAPAKASEAKPSEPKAAVPDSGNSKPNRFNRPPLGPPPSRPPPAVPASPPVRPPRPATPRGDRPPKAAAPSIPPPPQHPPPTPEELAERGRASENRQKEREEAADKTPAPRRASASAPPPRSRSRVDPSAAPRADGTFEDQDTEVLRIARGGVLSTPSFRLSARPVVLRPRDGHHPEVIINSEGTWVRVAKPAGSSDDRVPLTVPATVEGDTPNSPAEDPHELADEVWRDPSLVGARTTLVSSDRTQVIRIVEDTDTLVEEEEVG